MGIKLRRSEFVKNSMTLLTGTTIAQLIGILIYPVVSRMFPAEQFGLLSTISQIAAIIMILATGKYESSILITETKQEGANIIGYVLYRSSIILIILYIILQIFGKPLSTALHQPDLQKWLYICPITAFVIIIYNCFNEWCVRNKYYKVLSWNKIINTLSHSFGKMIFGFFNVISGGLILGNTVGRAYSAGTCVYRALKYDKKEFKQIDKKQFKPLAKKYTHFPKFNMPDQLLNTIGVAMPVFVLGIFFNGKEVGYYAMTMNVLSVPMSIISIALRDVFRQRANEDYVKTGSCIKIYSKLLYRLTFAAVVGSVAVIFFMPQIFAFVLGKQWTIAGEYSQILLPMIAIDFIASVFSGVFIVTDRLKESFFWQIYYVAITIVSLLIGGLFFKTVKATLICFAVGRSSAYLIYIYLSYKYAKGK